MCRTPATRRSNRNILSEIACGAPNRSTLSAVQNENTFYFAMPARKAPHDRRRPRGPGPDHPRLGRDGARASARPRPRSPRRSTTTRTLGPARVRGGPAADRADQRLPVLPGLAHRARRRDGRGLLPRGRHRLAHDRATSTSGRGWRRSTPSGTRSTTTASTTSSGTADEAALQRRRDRRAVDVPGLLAARPVPARTGVLGPRCDRRCVPDEPRTTRRRRGRPRCADRRSARAWTDAREVDDRPGRPGAGCPGGR